MGLFEKYLILSGNTNSKKVPCPSAHPRIKFWGVLPLGCDLKAFFQNKICPEVSWKNPGNGFV